MTLFVGKGIMEGDSDQLEKKQRDAILSFIGDCILETTTASEDSGGAVCFEALSEMYVCTYRYYVDELLTL